MNNAAPFEAFRFLDIDETLSTYKEFFQKYGYAPAGEVALKTQFQINGRQYSSIAAYSAIGLIAYRVVEGCTNAEVFQSFLDNEVNDGMLFNYFTNSFLHNPAHPEETFYENCKLLPHAHYIKISVTDMEINIRHKISKIIQQELLLL